MGKIVERLRLAVGTEVLGLGGFLFLVVIVFGLSAPNFLTYANFSSVASQLPTLGLLTLAMLIPIISGGLNLAIIYTANLAGLTLAYTLNAHGGVDASLAYFVIGSVAALTVGAASGCIMGLVIAYVGAHPILVSLAMMIFLRGLGEYLTQGGDISGFPAFLHPIGYGLVLGIPVPLLIFGFAALIWHVILNRTRHGFAARMIGSNIRAATYSGVHSKRTLTLIYTLSGVMCACAGILMLAQFNSVRVGHGEALLLVTVLACFMGGVDPFGGFGRVLPVVVALLVLQVLSSGLNLLGANQHLSTAVWGLFLIGVMVLRWTAAKLRQTHKGKG
jgi:simple sugar transport system permease protein